MNVISVEITANNLLVYFSGPIHFLKIYPLPQLETLVSRLFMHIWVFFTLAHNHQPRELSYAHNLNIWIILFYISFLTNNFFFRCRHNMVANNLTSHCPRWDVWPAKKTLSVLGVINLDPSPNWSFYFQWTESQCPQFFNICLYPLLNFD